MKIHDDFLPEDQYQSLFKYVSSPKFLWEYGWSKSGKGTDSANDLYNQQLVHKLHAPKNPFGAPPRSDPAPFFNLIEKLQPLTLIRVKLNLQVVTDKVYENPYHVDFSSAPDNVKVLTCVYYLNTNNGYTHFEDSGEKIYSIANRMIVFDHRIRHGGSTCTDQKNRMVVNINFIPSKKTNPNLWSHYE